MNYQLNRIEDTDIFIFANEKVDLLGKNLITDTFQEVLKLASTLKDDANDAGKGDLVSIENPSIELTDITNAEWYLLVLVDRFLIVRTTGTEKYNLPTNILEGSGKGSLENIFNKIIQLVN